MRLGRVVGYYPPCRSVSAKHPIFDHSIVASVSPPHHVTKAIPVINSVPLQSADSKSRLDQTGYLE